MPTKKRPALPAKNKQEAKPEEPRLFTGDIFVNKTLVSSITLKAAGKAAAQMAIYKMINVKVNG